MQISTYLFPSLDLLVWFVLPLALYLSFVVSRDRGEDIGVFTIGGPDGRENVGDFFR